MGYLCTQVLPTPHVYWPPDTLSKEHAVSRSVSDDSCSSQSREEQSCLGPCGQ